MDFHDGSHLKAETQDPHAPVVIGGADRNSEEIQREVVRAAPNRARKGAKQVDDVHSSEGAQASPGGIDLRFSSPQIAEIVQLHRMARRWTKAKNALVLQGKALCRAFVGGDKDAGTEAFDRVMSGKSTDDDFELVIALSPFIPAIERFTDELGKIDKAMTKLAKKLPIAPWVESVRGFGFSSLAHLVGEAGDLSAYPSVAGVWKRCGLAVIDGERQRKCADADKASAHGYSPERRSVFWNIAEPIARLQRTWVDKATGEIRKPADPYGEYLEAEKARALEAGLSPAHAENRAKRHMAKRVLRDMTVEWRRISNYVVRREEI